MLETIKGVKRIAGFNVVDMDAIRESRPEMFRPDGSMIYHLFDEKIRPFNFIYARHDVNSLSFNLQRGPVSTRQPSNGCTVDALIAAAKLIIEQSNVGAERCREYSCAATHLDEALHWLYALQRRKLEAERDAAEPAVFEAPCSIG